jgi:hypothetical protein
MGLIKTGLKAAVAVKVGHMVHDRIQQRQHAQWTAGQPAGMPSAAGAPPTTAPAAPPAAVPQAAVPQAPAAPAAPAAVPVGDTLAQLTKLGELKAAGVLTEAEFQAQKARILQG